MSIDIADLADRMEKAIGNLEELAEQARPEQTERKARLRGKAEGVALALSYLKDQPAVPSVPVAPLRAALDAANDERLTARDDRRERSTGSVHDSEAVARIDGEAYGIRRALTILDDLENSDA